MANSDKPAKSEAIADVTRPGKSAPSSTSKPILISHRPIMKDPMMVDDTARADTTEVNPEASAAAKPSSRLKIAPIHDDVAKATIEPGQGQAKFADDRDDERSTPANEAEPSKVEDTSVEATDTLHSDIDDMSPKPSTATEEEAAKKQVQHDTEMQKLVESRKYFLPINQVVKRRNKQYAVAGVILIIILGLAWADVALDAGIIAVSGVHAPTHFFK